MTPPKPQTSILCILIIIFSYSIPLSSSYSPTPPQPGSTAYGVLYSIPSTNFNSLHIWGNEYERGSAHGELLATQIIDWLEFFLIRTRLAGDVPFYNNFTTFLTSHFNFPANMTNELKGILNGMQFSTLFSFFFQSRSKPP